MSVLEMELLKYYRSLKLNTHTTQELFEWLWLEYKIAVEEIEAQNAKN